MIDFMERIVAVSLGRAEGDILFRGGSVVNVFSEEVWQADVLTCGDTIAAVGKGHGGARRVVDLRGKYLLPGFVNAHVHVESSMLTPAGYAGAVLPRGTTAVVCDPHEIVNVAGLAGLQFMINAGERTRLNFHFMVPSCVPATPLETAGCRFGEEEVWQAFKLFPTSPGLGEMMNYGGVLSAETGILSRIMVALGTDRIVDGHAPMLEADELNAYIAAGVSSDHEVTSAGEALERIRRGMKVIIREGSAARDLAAVLPAVHRGNAGEFMFGTDDRHPCELLRHGEMDDILRRAVKEGLDPVTAVRLASINTARHYRLKGRGAVAPGFKADLVVVDDLSSFEALEVYKDGDLVAREGKLLEDIAPFAYHSVESTVHLPELQEKLKQDFQHPAGEGSYNVITVQPGRIVTGWEKVPFTKAGPANDVVKVAVIERHGRNGNISVGLVKGFGLLRGALASTVAHDSHNLVVVGISEEDMSAAAAAVAEMGGGLAAALNGEILAALPLPVAGLMSDSGLNTVAESYGRVEEAARELGCVLPAPLMTMSFLTLPVIPELRITDRGLVDVRRLEFVPLRF